MQKLDEENKSPEKKSQTSSPDKKNIQQGKKDVRKKPENSACSCCTIFWIYLMLR